MDLQTEYEAGEDGNLMEEDGPLMTRAVTDSPEGIFLTALDSQTH